MRNPSRHLSGGRGYFSGSLGQQAAKCVEGSCRRCAKQFPRSCCCPLQIINHTHALLLLVCLTDASPCIVIFVPAYGDGFGIHWHSLAIIISRVIISKVFIRFLITLNHIIGLLRKACHLSSRPKCDALQVQRLAQLQHLDGCSTGIGITSFMLSCLCLWRSVKNTLAA